MWTNPTKGLKRKKLYEQNVSLHEAFVESVPTALLTIVITGSLTGQPNTFF